MSNRKFTETNAYSYSKLCDQFEKFKIPAFQRAYAWKPKQITDLWECITTNENEYFIGNLVCLAPREDDDDGRLIIIDGQQRLSTISLLLAAIRDEYKKIITKNREQQEIKNESVNEINEILFYKERRTYPVKKSLRLLPGKQNLIDIYGRIIEGSFDFNDSESISTLDDNQKKYIRNYKLISSLIHKHIKNSTNAIRELNELESKVRNLLLIVIICASDSDAYQIFEGLNATGVGLSVADLVKNSVMQSAKGIEAKTEIEDLWEQLESVFEKTRTSLFPKFLRHQWIAHNGYISNSQLFDEIKKQKLRNKESSSIVKFTKELLDDSRAYIAFRDSDFDSYIKKKLSKKSLAIIDRFRFLDLDQVYELILSYYNRHITDKNYNNKQFENDIEKLWVFSFRARLISVNPSEYEKKFADHCRDVKVFNKKETDRMSVKFYEDLSKLVTKDQVFIENFVADLRYSNDNNLIKYVLSEIMHKDQKNISINDPTIEHILPQDSKEWNKTDLEIEDYVHDIGNLTLLNLGDNQELSNATMGVKVKKVFSKSHFDLNKKLVDLQYIFESDPKEAIKSRGYELAKIANDIFNSSLKIKT